MKKMLCHLFVFSAFVSFSQDYYQRLGVVNYWQDFQADSTEVLYGDNVVLRKKPATDSKALDTLSIGSEVRILRKTKEVIELNGKQSFWYQVATKKGTGYVAGGLIAAASCEYNGGTYLVITAGPENQPKFRVRYLKNGAYFGKEGALGHSAFQLVAQGDKGLEGIESMVILDYFAEACGVDGGYTYLFNDGTKLINAIHCSSIGDGGYWFSEKLTFPDERGWGTHVDYEREVGKPRKEEMNWYHSQKDVLTLEWKEGRFSPNVSQINFEQE